MPERSWRTRRKAVEYAVRLMRSLSMEDQLAVWAATRNPEWCEAPGCTADRERYRRMCAAHRKRVQRHGDAMAREPVRRWPGASVRARWQLTVIHGHPQVAVDKLVDKQGAAVDDAGTAVDRQITA